MEHLRETQVSSREIFDGKILHIFEDTVLLPNGREAIREVIRHVGAVCVIPITEDRQVILEKQFRYPMEEVLLEIPAGKLDSPREDHLEAAKRELWEETGITADRFVDLGVFYPAAAYSGEKIHMYLALDLHYGQRHLDEDEFLDVVQMPLDQLLEEVKQGKVPDAKTQLAVMKAAMYLAKEK